MDAEHQGGGSPVAATPLKHGPQQGRLDEFKEPLIELGLDGSGAIRAGFLAGPSGDLLLNALDARRSR
jgi:hypothetical protein